VGSGGSVVGSAAAAGEGKDVLAILKIFFYGKTLHILSFIETRSPWTVCTFCAIPEQGKCVDMFLFVPMRSTK
jgi:hypothetical protein